MVKLVCIVISVIAMLCMHKFDETIKFRYLLATCVLGIFMFILVLKEDLWL